MKVAIISPYQIADGVARYTAELVGALQDSSLDLGVDVIPWNYPNKGARLLLPLMRTAGIASRLGSTDIVHIQFIASWYLCHLFLPLWLARLNNPKLKIVFTVHETNDNTFAPWLFNWLQNIYLSASDAIVVHSQYHRGLLPEFYRKKTSVIPLGVPRVSVDEIGEDSHLVLLPGFINAWKGYDLAIKALNYLKDKLPDLYLVVLGKAHSSRYTQQLIDLVKVLKLADRVRFETKFVPNDEFSRYFQKASIVLLPYRRIAMSAVLALAVAYRKVTIMSDLQPLREYTKGQGLYFVSGNFHDLAERIQEVAGNKVLRARQKNLFAKLGQEYSQKVIAQRTFDLYKKLYAD